MADNLRAKLARHTEHICNPSHVVSGCAMKGVCIVCGLVLPCDASRARAALDTAEQERDEAKSQVAALREALTETPRPSEPRAGHPVRWDCGRVPHRRHPRRPSPRRSRP